LWTATQRCAPPFPFCNLHTAPSSDIHLTRSISALRFHTWFMQGSVLWDGAVVLSDFLTHRVQVMLSYHHAFARAPSLVDQWNWEDKTVVRRPYPSPANQSLNKGSHVTIHATCLSPLHCTNMSCLSSCHSISAFVATSCQCLKQGCDIRRLSWALALGCCLALQLCWAQSG
jgi:hypothetical protein